MPPQAGQLAGLSVRGHNHAPTTPFEGTVTVIRLFDLLVTIASSPVSSFIVHRSKTNVPSDRAVNPGTRKIAFPWYHPGSASHNGKSTETPFFAGFITVPSGGDYATR